MVGAHSTKLSLCATFILLHLSTGYSQQPDSHSPSRSQVLSPSRVTLKDKLAEILYPNLSQCMRAMCAPRVETYFPWRCRGFGVATDEIADHLLSKSNDFPTSGREDSLETARKALGMDSSFIVDDNGQLIGIRPAGDRPIPADKKSVPVGYRPVPESPPSYGPVPARPSPAVDIIGRPTYNGGFGAFGGSSGYGFAGGFGGPGSSIQLPPGAISPPTSAPRSDNNIDVDVCCKTRVTYLINTTLTDVFGRTRTIAQFNLVGADQLVRHAFCGERGACPGDCVIENIILPLVIHPFGNNQHVSFSFFELPGYCTCRVGFYQGR